MIELFPYQLEGAQFLSQRPIAILGDEMGLGKTPQAIRALNLIQSPPSKNNPVHPVHSVHPHKKVKKPSLVVCPAIARTNWEREFKRFDLLGHPIFGAFRAADLSKWDGKSHLIVSYTLCFRLKDFIVDNFGIPGLSNSAKLFQTLILDEIHFLKNRSAHRTKVILGTGGLVHYAERVWGLSGTLMPNHAGELWTLLYTFGVTPLSYNQFVKKFCNQRGGFVTERGYAPSIITGTKRSAIPELKKLLSQVMLRRTVASCGIELPPLRFGEITLPKPPPEVTEELLNSVDRERLEFEKQRLGASQLSLEVLGLLSSSVSTLRRFTGLSKVHSLSALLSEELENREYEKLVIFCAHTDVALGLRKRLEKFGAATLIGQDTTPTRQKVIDEFQKPDGSLRVVIANILAAGTAINLTAAHNVVFAELSWVPGDNAQALKRSHRIGQGNSVYVRTVTLEDSVDNRVNEILERKMKDILLTMGDEETLLTTSLPQI